MPFPKNIRLLAAGITLSTVLSTAFLVLSWDKATAMGSAASDKQEMVAAEGTGPDTAVSSDGTVVSSPPVSGDGSPGVSAGSPGSMGGSDGSAPYPGTGVPDGPMPPDQMNMPSCDFKNYVGLPVDKLDQKAIFKDRPVRVITPNMGVTMDFSPDRINIMIDETTRVITDITCG